MNKGQNEFNDKTAKYEGRSSVSEKEMENVTGGFTILDTCQKHWDPAVCYAIWGACPHLNIVWTGEKCNFYNGVPNYLASCDKGYFKGAPYSETSNEQDL